ncbi:MAG: TlyA family RNA methyltransferase [Campylobacterales bacterium]
MRLDSWLVEKGIVESRTKAQALIVSGKVLVNGRSITKPSFAIENGDVMLLEEPYVGRGAWKLKGYLEESGLSIKGVACLDIGSSTGGFTQVLLEYGAAHVTCVDVGKDQLHPSLRQDPRVTLYEGMDIRAFKASTPFELVTGDLSFISLTGLLSVIDRLANSHIILLFKPQFEVGPAVKRNSKGVVQDLQAIETAKTRFLEAAKALGWQLIAWKKAKIEGKEGNQEYVCHFTK